MQSVSVSFLKILFVSFAKPSFMLFYVIKSENPLFS